MWADSRKQVYRDTHGLQKLKLSLPEVPRVKEKKVGRIPVSAMSHVGRAVRQLLQGCGTKGGRKEGEEMPISLFRLFFLP